MQRKKQFFILLLFLCTMNLHALSLSSWYAEKAWRPIVALGTGASISSDVGASQHFPILNPITSEFYNYSAQNKYQTSGLIDLFIGAEWNLFPWLLQLGLAFNQTSSFAAKGRLTQGANSISADTYTYQYKILARQLLLEGKLLYSFNEIYHPYLFAGIGSAFNKAYNYETNVPDFLAFTRIYSNNHTNSFTYALGFGLDIDINCYLRAGLGYRFVNLGKVHLGNARIDTTNVPGTLSQSHFYTNEFLAQLTWVN